MLAALKENCGISRARNGQRTGEELLPKTKGKDHLQADGRRHELKDSA